MPTELASKLKCELPLHKSCIVVDPKVEDWFVIMQRTLLKKDVVKVISEDGEIHFVLRDQTTKEKHIDCLHLNAADLRAVLKREASKPLLLLRAE